MSAEPLADRPTALSPQERSQQVSRALSDAARRLRFTSQGRRAHPGGFRARRGRLLVKLLYIASFFAMVAVPSLGASVYYGLIAADQFEAEAKFAVRSGALAGLDPLTTLTGVPAVQIIQDTQVVTDFIRSRAVVDELQSAVDLRNLYGREEADWWSRLRPDKPVEKVLKYWQSMISIGIEMPGGIVHFNARAFRPEDSVAIVRAVVAASEKLVNNMNDRSRRDAVSFADQEMQLATTRLAQARADLEVARNREGTLDATTSAIGINAIISIVRAQQLQMKQQLDTTMASNVSAQAPQVRDLRLRIEAADRQIEQLQREMTSTAAGDAPTLSASMTRLAALTMRSRVAETQYTSAAVSLERARMASLTKQIYLTSFVQPVLPEEAQYPRRYWIVFLVFAIGLVSWGAFCGLVTVARNHMA